MEIIRGVPVGDEVGLETGMIVPGVISEKDASDLARLLPKAGFTQTEEFRAMLDDLFEVPDDQLESPKDFLTD